MNPSIDLDIEEDSAWIGSWVESQESNPDFFTRLGKKLYEAETTEPLTVYQQVYLNMTNSQQEVFWTEFNHRKKELMPQAVYTRSAKGLVAQIQNMDEMGLGNLKRKIWRIQKGDIKIHDPPEDDEWTLIWNEMKQKQYQFINPLPEIPEGKSRCGHCYRTHGKMYRPKIDLQLGRPIRVASTSDGVCHCLSCDGF